MSVRSFFTGTLLMLMVFAALAVGASAAFGGTTAATGALAGAGLGTLDLLLLAVAAAVLVRRTGAAGAGASGFFLALKFPVLAGVLYLLIVVLALPPVGVALGFGALPAALVAGVLAGRIPLELRLRSDRSHG